MAARGVLMVLCGLPASGKTYLSNLLKQSGETPDVHIFHICYDDFIPSNLSTKDNSSWKYYRTLINKCIEKVLIQYLDKKTTIEDSKVNNDLPSFSEFWIEFIKIQTSRERTCCFSLSQNCVHACHVFLIDDNMFYRSMRHEYFLLARKYNLGYAQVFIDCSLETALNTNSLRPNPVQSKTIITMASKMEEPSPEKFTWEANTLKLNWTDRDGLPSCNWTDRDGLPSSILQRLHTLIKKAADNPVSPLEEEDQEVKEKSRAALVASVIYQTDQILRKGITNQMRMAKDEGCSKQQMKTLAEVGNNKRKLFLEELKNAISFYKEFSHIDDQSVYDQTDFQHQLTVLSKTSTRDNYMKECAKILKTFINQSHFDIAVQFMFKHYCDQ